MTQNILSYALSNDCKIGFSSGTFPGNSYTEELPDEGIKYGTWEITKRSQNTITIKVFSPYKSTMWVNSYVNTAGWNGWKQMVVNTDLRFYSTTNGITKIASLPWGIYNLQDSEVRALTEKPSELNQGRAIIITSGLSTNDEKVALILASSGRDGGVYFGYVWGSNTPEFSWKKIIGNNA